MSQINDWLSVSLIKQYNYAELLKYYAGFKYQSLGGEEITALVGAYLSNRDDLGEDAVKDHTTAYHLDVLEAMRGRIDAGELQMRLIKPIVEAYKKTVINDYEKEINSSNGKSEGEEWEEAFIR